MMNKEMIENAYGSIEIPSGMEKRLQEKLEKALGEPLREKRLVLRPRPRLLKPLVTAAAVVLVLLAAFTVIRLSHVGEMQSIPLVPAASPEATNKTWDPETRSDFLRLYQTVLGNYRYALDTRDRSFCEDAGISNLFLPVNEDQPFTEIGIALEDLDGDGTPELLIGPLHSAMLEPGSLSETLYDAYCLIDGEPRQIFCADSTNKWRYLGGGLFLQSLCEQYSNPTHVLWQARTPRFAETGLLLFQGGVSLDPFTNPENGIWHKVEDAWKPAPVEGRVSEFSCRQGEAITDQEAQAWIEQHQHYVWPAFTALEEVTIPAPTPEPDVPAGMTEQQYQELLSVLNLIEKREEAFALVRYTGLDTDGVVRLLEQIRLLALDRGLTPSQYRGVLLGNQQLDGASAEAYAALMGELYKLDPNAFLSAWHEAGEPADLMQEVTGILDSAESKLWLREQFERSKGSILD